MKKYNLYALCLFVTLLAAACKKSNPSATCHLASISEVGSAGSLTVSNLITLQYTGDNISAYTYSTQYDSTGTTIAHIGDTLISATRNLPGGNITLDTQVVNSSGFVVWAGRPSIGQYAVVTMKYDADGQLVSTKTWDMTNDTLMDSTTYTWSAGDCMSTVKRFANSTSVFTSTYTYYADVLAPAEDISDMLQWHGYKTMKSKHAVKTLEVTGSFYSYTYQTDNNGRVTEGQVSVGTIGQSPSMTGTISYTYSCH